MASSKEYLQFILEQLSDLEEILQYCHFDNFVLLTSSGLDGDYVPIPT